MEKSLMIVLIFVFCLGLAPINTVHASGNQKRCVAWCKSNKKIGCHHCSKNIKCNKGYVKIKSFKGKGLNWYACKVRPKRRSGTAKQSKADRQKIIKSLKKRERVMQSLSKQIKASNPKNLPKRVSQLLNLSRVQRKEASHYISKEQLHSALLKQQMQAPEHQGKFYEDLQSEIYRWREMISVRKIHYEALRFMSNLLYASYESLRDGETKREIMRELVRVNNEMAEVHEIIKLLNSLIRKNEREMRTAPRKRQPRKVTLPEDISSRKPR